MMIRNSIMRLSQGLFAALVLLFATQSIALAAVDCFSCHKRSDFSKKVTHGPVAEGKCFSCHNPHVARFAGLLQRQVKDLCYSCHANLAEEEQKEGGHQPFKAGECTSCHNPHASQQAGLLNKRLADTCFGCHGELAKKYKYTHAPFAKGDCSTCHNRHQSPFESLLVKAPKDLCQGCHSPASVQQKHANYPEKIENCSSCHNPHGSDRPALVRNFLHKPYADGCSSCHVGKGVPVRVDTCIECHPQVSKQMASSHNHLVRYKDNTCMACHSPHAGDNKNLLKGTERNICGSCHQSTFKRYEAASFKHKMTSACNDCHAPHGSNHPNMLKAEINKVCSECHAKHTEFTHPIGDDVFDPRTGQVMTCSSCHASKGTGHDYHTRFDRKKALCIQCHDTY